MMAFRIAATVLGVALVSGCAGFSTFQSAALAGPGETEVTPAGTVVWADVGDSRERFSHHLGVRVTRGVAERADFIAGFEYIGLRDDQPARWVLGGGPKLALVPDRLAIWIPVGTLFGEGVETRRSWQANPTVLLTVELTPEVDLTPSVMALVPLDRDLRADGEYALAVNLGAGWSPAGAAWTLRPEGGVIWDPDIGFDDRAWHFGLGVTLPLGR